MFNWRRPILALYDAHVTRHPVPGYVGLLQRVHSLPADQRRMLQTERLIALLQHAAQRVPLYRERVAQAGLVHNGEVDLARFRRLPELTRDVLRTEFDKLKSDDAASRSCYVNSSGGSSGQPVKLLQDTLYHDMSMAVTEMHYAWAGWQPGEPVIRIWGSERDILLGSVGWRNGLSAFARNQRVLNAFRMGQAEMRRYVQVIRRHRPVVIEAYAESVYEFSRYLNMNKIHLPGVRQIITSAGTLYPFMRDEVERAFACGILNRYGSREVGDCAAERVPGGGLEAFTYTHLLEVVNERGEPCGVGEEGDVLVTSLTNFAMPLIRYRIGDRAVAGALAPGPLASVEHLRTVTGRSSDVFVREDGTTIPAAFFIHFIGVVHNDGWLKKTQIIQQCLDHVLIKVVAMHPPPPGALERIRTSLQAVMGAPCRVDFEFVDDILPLPSGKYRYTISLVPRAAPAGCLNQ